MEIKLLYGLDKGGKFKVWKIWTEGATLFIEHGKEGGKQQLKSEVVEGKNIGRANETTPAEQAELEAMSRWRKQVDKGYRETKGELEELPLLPMLAQDYLKQGHRIQYPCFGSPKLDGVRCLAIRHPHRVELKSRGGKEYTVIHIEQQLMDCMKVGDVFDGELYIHGKYLEEIVSAVKKPNDDTPNLNYVVFDIVTDETYEHRLIELQKLRRHTLSEFSLSRINVISFCEIQDEEHMKQKHKEYVAAGYEGIMLRNHDGVYESGKRSADLQKYKEFFDEEFRIVDVAEDRNGNGVLVVWDALAGTHFDCCYGDFDQRKHQLNNPEQYVGKALTVKYQTRYKDSRLPQFPTGVRIREGEWIDDVFYPSE
jgi:DNA ligase-1